MSNGNQQQRRTFNPSLFNVMSNWLYGEPVQEGLRPPTFRTSVVGNVPRLTTHTNVPGDVNNGRIEFNIDLDTFSTALALLVKLAEGTATHSSYVFGYEDDFLAGKKLDSKMLISELEIGKDAETGKIYIAILSAQQSRPKIRFFFGPSRFHSLRSKGGAEITPGEISAAYAIGWARSRASIVEKLLVERFDPDARNVAKPPHMQNREGGGGGNQRSTGGGGGRNYGNQQRQGAAAEVENFEDIDW